MATTTPSRSSTRSSGERTPSVTRRKYRSFVNLPVAFGSVRAACAMGRRLTAETWQRQADADAFWTSPCRRELDAHPLDAVDEGRLQHVGRAGHVDVRQTVEQLLEHHPDLAAREVGAEAEVRPSRPEADVIVRRPRHVEAVRVVPEPLVPVRGVVPENHLVARADLLPAHLDVARGGAAEVDHGRRPADDL